MRSTENLSLSLCTQVPVMQGAGMQGASIQGGGQPGGFSPGQNQVTPQDHEKVSNVVQLPPFAQIFLESSFHSHHVEVPGLQSPFGNDAYTQNSL